MPPSAPDELAAVVVAYRSAGVLGSCLAGLRGCAGLREVVVVDNSSESASRDVVVRAAEQGLPVRYIDPGDNLGFAAACNLGALSTTAPLLLLLNPDVHLEQDLGPLRRLVQHGMVAAAGGLADDQGHLSNAKADATAVVELRRALTGLRPLRLPADGALHEVAQVDGAMLLIARPTFDQLGGLAEEFPLYYEDVDLCWRLRRSGGRVVLHAMRYGTHIGGASSRQNPTAYVALRLSRLRFLRRRYGRRTGIVLGLALCASELVTRTAGNTSESSTARRLALRTCWLEARNPMSQQPLR